MLPVLIGTVTCEGGKRHPGEKGRDGCERRRSIKNICIKYRVTLYSSILQLFVVYVHVHPVYMENERRGRDGSV